MPMAPEELETEARQVAIEAVRAAGNPRDLRCEPVSEAQAEWSQGHLRTLREQRFGVYERLGDLTLEVDGRGRLLRLEDPRHKPSEPGVFAGANDVVDRVCSLCSLPKNYELIRGEVEFDGKFRFIRVWTIPSGDGREGPRIEAFANAVDGGIWKLTCEPPPRLLPPKWARAGADEVDAEDDAEEGEDEDERVAGEAEA